MFKKKCLFGGGLCLGSSIAIFASISSDVIAMEAVKAKNSIHDFRSELNQIVWNCDCSFKEYCTKSEKMSNRQWILDDKYKDSRTKVIGKAIGDCVAGEGAFANKTSEEIITFKDTDPKTYKQRNWNAVILYNYIHEAINNKKIDDTSLGNYLTATLNVKNVLKNKLEKLKEHYEAECGEKCIKRLVKAVEHIQKYVLALGLYTNLRGFRVSKWKYDCDKAAQEDPSNLAPNLSADLNKNGVCVYPLPFYHVDESLKTQWMFSPSFQYEGGKLYISELKVQQGSGKKGEDDRYIWVDDRLYYVQTVDELKKGKGKWLMERLEGLVDEPTEDLWNKWHPKKK